MLLVAALVTGTVDAFYFPSAGSMPRRLVTDAQLPRALALRQSGSQLVSMVGGPLGGVAVAAAGFAAAAWGDVATFAAMLVVLVAIRAHLTPPPKSEGCGNLLRDVVDGLRLAMATRGLRAMVLLLAGAAGFIIPVGSLLIPLLVRATGWGATAAGILVGAQGTGTIVVTLLVARRGASTRPGLAAITGLLVTAAGQVAVALAGAVPVAACGALVVGAGTGLFVSNLSPVLLGAAPKTHLARIQALLTLAQSSALLLTNNLLGNLARTFHPVYALYTCAAVLLACALFGCATPSIRRLAPSGET